MLLSQNGVFNEEPFGGCSSAWNCFLVGPIAPYGRALVKVSVEF